MYSLPTKTLEDLRGYGYRKEDVAWIGTENGEFAIDLDGFLAAAQSVDKPGQTYDHMVPTDLVMVLRDGNFLTWDTERSQFDDEYAWTLHVVPQLAANHKKLDFKFDDGFGFGGNSIKVTESRD